MHRARERGMSFWPFLVTLILLLVLVVMWFSASGERDNALAQKKRAEESELAAKQETERMVRQLNAATGAVGFPGGGGWIDPELVKTQLADYGKRLRDAMVVTFPTTRYQAGTGGGVIEKTDADKVTVAYLTESELSDNPTLQTFLNKFEVAARRMRADVESAMTRQSEQSVSREQAVKAHAAALSEKDTRIGELTTEKTALQTRMDEQGTELRNQLAAVTAQKEARESELEQIKKQMGENETKLLAKNKELAGTISTLVQRDAPALSEGPDGEVVLAQDGVAVINRGKKHFLMPGTVFDVSGKAKGGATYLKGQIKVTACDDDTARTVVLSEVDPHDPIMRGDTIQSQTYSPNRKLHFVLIGDFKKMGRSMVEARLKALGAIVDDKVTAETHYLVEGLPAQGQNLEDNEEHKHAKELGIRIITEDQLASFTKF
jgi:hypothetical protein